MCGVTGSVVLVGREGSYKFHRCREVCGGRRKRLIFEGFLYSLLEIERCQVAKIQ